MNQALNETDKLLVSLEAIAVNQQITYGHISWRNVTETNGAVAKQVEKLEQAGRLMRFQRKVGREHQYDLIAVGTTPAIIEKIRAGIERYELKVGLTSKGIPMNRGGAIS